MRTALAGALIAGSLLAPIASAQVGVRPGDERPELPEFEAPAPGPELILPPIPEPRPSEQGRLGAQPILFVRGYRFEGVIAAADHQLAREHVVKGTALIAADRCDVTGDAGCDVEDLAVLERLVNLVLPPPPLVDRCEAYTTP